MAGITVQNGDITLNVDGIDHVILDKQFDDLKLIDVKVFGMYYVVEGSMRVGYPVKTGRPIDILWNPYAVPQKVIWVKVINSTGAEDTMLIMFRLLEYHPATKTSQNLWISERVWNQQFIDSNLFGVNGTTAIYLDHGIITSMIIAPVDVTVNEQSQLKLEDYLNIADRYRTTNFHGHERFKTSYVI